MIIHSIWTRAAGCANLGKTSFHRPNGGSVPQMTGKYQAIVIGSGHNGLANAAFLAPEQPVLFLRTG